MKFDALLHKLANQHGWTILYIREEDSYRIQVTTPGDRRQDVFVTFRKDDAGAWIATMWSTVAKVEDFNLTDPLELLRFNWRHLYGALAVSQAELNINPEFFVTKVLDTLIIEDLLTGLAKTVVFAYFISVTACWKGLDTEGGTQGVGNTTTWVVVAASIFIMIADFFLTKFFIITVFSHS